MRRQAEILEGQAASKAAFERLSNVQQVYSALGDQLKAYSESLGYVSDKEEKAALIISIGLILLRAPLGR